MYKQRYEKDIQEEAVQLLYSIAVSIFAIGGMLGGFSGGIIANRFGRYFFDYVRQTPIKLFCFDLFIKSLNLFYRKGGLLLNNVLGISGACLMGFTKYSNSYELLFIGRFIIGVNCG